MDWALGGDGSGDGRQRLSQDLAAEDSPSPIILIEPADEHVGLIALERDQPCDVEIGPVYDLGMFLNGVSHSNRGRRFSIKAVTASSCCGVLRANA